MSTVERRQVSTPDGNPTPISWSPVCNLVTMVTEPLNKTLSHLSVVRSLVFAGRMTNGILSLGDSFFRVELQGVN